MGSFAPYDLDIFIVFRVYYELSIIINNFVVVDRKIHIKTLSLYYFDLLIAIIIDERSIQHISMRGSLILA